MCEKSETFCGACSDCVKNHKGIHPDVFFIEEGEQKSISVDKIRDINKTLHIYPNEAKVKVYMIKNAQDMTVQAQNALLKMLEEPPYFVMFILTVDKRQKLLDTIVSRCVCFKLEPGKTGLFKEISGNIASVSAAQGPVTVKPSKDDIKKQKYEQKIKGLCISFVRLLSVKKEFEFLNFYKELYKNKDYIKDILDWLIFLFRDILWYNNSGKKSLEYYAEYADEIERISSYFSEETLINMIEILENTKEEIIQNVNFNACISVFQICIWEEVYG